MKCSRCGADIEDGKLFCSRCGQEVQLVPNYDTLGSRLFETEAEEANRKKEEPSKKEEAKPQKKHGVRPLAVGIALLLVCMGALLAVKAYMDHRNYNSFDYQLERAETAYSNKSYEEGLEYAKRAAALDPGSLKALLLKARIHVGLGEIKDAEEELLLAISQDPESRDAYGQLLQLYESEGKTDEIKELMDACTSDTIKNKYADYICEPVTFGMGGGEYFQPISLRLSAGDDTSIYYTTDGSMPTQHSARYEKPISLSEGETVVSAIAVNGKGIESDAVSNTYTITLKAPAPPQIALGSGTYADDMDTTIYVFVQENCRAYYSFDEMPTTESSLYTKDGIAMPEGTHTLYVISVNQYGKVSTAASETYTLNLAKKEQKPKAEQPAPTEAPAAEDETQPEDAGEDAAQSASEVPEE